MEKTKETNLMMQRSCSALLTKYGPAAISDTFGGITTAKESFAMQMANRGSVKTLYGMAEGARDGVQLTLEERRKNRKLMISVLSAHLVGVDNFMKQDKPMTEDEVNFAATDIYDNYGQFLTFADINVVFTRAKRGDFGKLYNKLMASDVIGWFRAYSIEKDEAIQQYRSEEKTKQEQKPFALPYELVKKTDKNGTVVKTVAQYTETYIAEQKKKQQQEEEEKRQARQKRADLRAFNARCEELCQERKITYEEAYKMALLELNR